ncbi:MAG: AAA family ATPase [Prochloraceae cyanobacterium]|nr:AAA family ATPase [Prochloraceae cyanobacterium]
MLIAVANQKGGVAKTTTTICLGGLLTPRGTCLLVDLDPQGDLTLGLGFNIPDKKPSCYEVITEKASAASAIVSTKSGLNLLPAEITLAKGETEILTQVGNFYILKEKLESITVNYSYILIDCPPSLGLLTVNALAAADTVLIPVQCQFFALKGLASLLDTIATVQKRLNPQLKILGVLPTMAENTIMTQDVLASLRKRQPSLTIFEPVPKSVKFSEANLAGEPIHSYSKEDKLIKPYQKLADFITNLARN